MTGQPVRMTNTIVDVEETIINLRLFLLLVFLNSGDVMEYGIAQTAEMRTTAFAHLDFSNVVAIRAENVMFVFTVFPIAVGVMGFKIVRVTKMSAWESADSTVQNLSASEEFIDVMENEIARISTMKRTVIKLLQGYHMLVLAPRMTLVALAMFLFIQTKVNKFDNTSSPRYYCTIIT